MIIYTDRYSTNPTIQGKRLIIKSKILSTKGLFKYRVSKFGLHPDPPLPLVRESDLLAKPLYLFLPIICPRLSYILCIKEPLLKMIKSSSINNLIKWCNTWY